MLQIWKIPYICSLNSEIYALFNGNLKFYAGSSVAWDKNWPLGE